MRIGNRLFPYPTLNSERTLSEYEPESEFNLCFDIDKDGQLPCNIIGQHLNNTFFKLTDPGLLELYNQGKANCVLVVECSASTYRETFPLTLEPQNFILKNQNLKGTVNVSSYLYATEAISHYSNPRFQTDYKPYYFDIEKYDILAIDDGFKFQVNIDPTLDNKVPSIFTIVPRTTTDNQMEYEIQDNNIIISLPDEYYTKYDNIKGKTNFNNMMFAMIAIPALSGALYKMQQSIIDGYQLDDLTEKFRWIRSVCASYKRVKNQELTEEEFKDINPVVLAQCVLNDATCNGIEEISEHLLRGKDREEADEDE